ncbi:hypothetical protein BOW86_gp132 [Synechococcus phage S-CAM7]|jgi:hypothetical protein|uniref:Uncharacterized protein n=1 Tax=Synechococcus phage S-CAM7 TaxID=1883368 RepID=A0A1D8KTR2_9CAUD|nr:hypothetical protein BOW86_gp132 [Synechococcus phage S-CAM7]AOV62056.1 hypothetical protein C490910_132 [Synechococcus phage S-CAM7]AOV62319.1 hypothetical protein S420910_131 [Synechococcus phage S-CAM7]QLF86183.1 hypothetical protein CC030809_00127 [Synechococcus phage S-CAM7]
MANLLDQIGQRNVVRVLSNGVPSSLEGLTDTDFNGIQDGSVPVWNGEVFSQKVESCQLSTSSCILTVDPVTKNTAFTDTLDGGFF